MLFFCRYVVPDLVKLTSKREQYRWDTLYKAYLFSFGTSQEVGSKLGYNQKPTDLLDVNSGVCIKIKSKSLGNYQCTLTFATEWV